MYPYHDMTWHDMVEKKRYLLGKKKLKYFIKQKGKEWIVGYLGKEKGGYDKYGFSSFSL